MTSYPKTKLSKGTKPCKSLSKVLAQSERVKDMVAECAKELSTVNLVLTQELADLGPPPELEDALKKSETVENKVHAAAEKLSVVNEALENEINERNRLEHQLAAAIAQEEAARHAAFHDSLTGLPNRVLFNDRLEHGLMQAKRHGRSMAVMFLDLNEFKSINDSQGHDVGDCVLQIISQRLRENTREDDTVSRHGGDEFLYLLMEIQDERDITLKAEKILKAVQAPCHVSIRERAVSLRIDASIGISIYPKDGVTADALVRSADKAMYQAKRSASGYSFAR